MDFKALCVLVSNNKSDQQINFFLKLRLLLLQYFRILSIDKEIINLIFTLI